jgi:hypothetical protein
MKGEKDGGIVGNKRRERKMSQDLKSSKSVLKDISVFQIIGTDNEISCRSYIP